MARMWTLRQAKVWICCRDRKQVEATPGEAVDSNFPDIQPTKWLQADLELVGALARGELQAGDANGRRQAGAFQYIDELSNKDLLLRTESSAVVALWPKPRPVDAIEAWALRRANVDEAPEYLSDCGAWLPYQIAAELFDSYETACAARDKLAETTGTEMPCELEVLKESSKICPTCNAVDWIDLLAFATLIFPRTTKTYRSWLAFSRRDDKPSQYARLQAATIDGHLSEALCAALRSGQWEVTAEDATGIVRTLTKRDLAGLHPEVIDSQLRGDGRVWAAVRVRQAVLMVPAVNLGADGSMARAEDVPEVTPSLSLNSNSPRGKVGRRPRVLDNELLSTLKLMLAQWKTGNRLDRRNAARTIAKMSGRAGDTDTNAIYRKLLKILPTEQTEGDSKTVIENIQKRISEMENAIPQRLSA